MNRFIMIFLLALLSWLPSELMAKENKLKYNLAVVSIFKDNAPYLKEWIEYHRMMGVQHFYLFDNSSSDHPKRVLKPYIKKGVVTFIDWPNRAESTWKNKISVWIDTTQMPAYRLGLKLAKDKAKWVAFIDTDEFITPMKENSFTPLLKKYEECAAIYLYWTIYGTSNVDSIPPNRLMIELLTYRSPHELPMNCHTKYIVQPDQCKSLCGPHVAEVCENAQAVNISREEARLNHYINRTVDFFYTHKIKAKETMDHVKWNEETIRGWLDLGNDVEDRTMDRFVPELRRRMGMD